MTTPTQLTIDAVLAALGELPHLASLLPAALTCRTPADESRRPVPGPRAPVRLDALALLDTRTGSRFGPDLAEWVDPDRAGILPYLWTWCRDLEADAYDHSPTVPDELPEHPTVGSCCQYIAKLMPFAVTLPQWDELADGITHMHQRALAATRALRDPEPTRPAICNLCHTGTLTQTGPNLWQCTACYREVTIQAVTIPQAAQITGIPQRTIRAWATRHLLISAGRTGKAPLYDLGSIRRVHAEALVRRQAA